MDGILNDEEKNRTEVMKVEVDSSSEKDQVQQPSPISRFLETLRGYEDALDRKLGVEAHSIERKLPDQRNPFYARKSSQLTLFAFWAGCCTNLSTFVMGFLGWELGLSLKQNILVIVFGSIAGASITSWCATMGPPTGLRQVSICRYSLGWYPSKAIAILNVFQMIGWCASTAITGGQALSAFADNKVGTGVGVVICCVASLVFSLLGLKAVYQFMKYAWVVFVAIFLVILGETARFGDLASPPSVVGATGSGAALNLFSIMYGAGACCAGYASDYYVEYPVNIPKVKIFLMTFLGLCLSTWVCAIPGAIVASALPNNPEWMAQYDAGIGFLVQEIVYPYGFAKVILFLLMFTAIGVNGASMYSAGLSVQQASRFLAVIPRFIWTLLCFAAIIVLSLAGSDQLQVFLQDFLSMLGYYATAVFVCLLIEHYVFRRGSFHNYKLEAWNTPAMLPIGYAGGLAFVCGIIGAVLGMSTTWYTGVAAKLIGDLGGDIGNELCFLFTLAVYIPARFVERQLVGR
ncbi:putative nucleoside transporter [Hypoxylon rubiginosum]|uniref:Nucleoside transporter n=1 Tax=Hypoxylon rubiginosum TaxID=110542 RepID=A0ACC0DB41_9PEZI|nr:putative nucleoside transporter [Hypoxylon rubiginosum]